MIPPSLSRITVGVLTPDHTMLNTLLAATNIIHTDESILRGYTFETTHKTTGCRLGLGEHSILSLGMMGTAERISSFQTTSM